MVMKSYAIPPDGFKLFGLEIKFYGLIVAIAMLLGVVVACKLAKKRGFKTDDIILLAVICLPLAIVGARLYYCFFYEYNYSFKELFNIRSGGLAILGGVIGGIVGVLIFCAIKKNIKLLIDIFDICVPALILGQAIGRVGCFFSQCCYGKMVLNPNWQWFPFAMKVETYPGSGIYAWHLATNLYESVWNFVGFGLILLTYLKTNKKLLPTATYLVWYGLGRAFIEGLRGDSLFIGNSSIRVSQLVSIFMFIIGGVILLTYLIKHFKQKNAK